MKQFVVKMWFGGSQTATIVYASNSAHALSIAKKLHPKARIISAVLNN